MTQTILIWGGLGLAGLAGLLLLVVVVAAVTDRASAEPITVDHDAPEVRAFLDAERAWMAHHRLEFTEHIVEVDNPAVRVRVLEVGDGPPAVLLPGGAGDAAYYAPLLEELDGRRALLVNLPGGGGSDGVDFRAISDRRLARDTLDAVYAHFDLDAAAMVGFSRGGTWVLWYGLLRPERVSAAMLLGAVPLVEGGPVPADMRMLGMPGVNRIIASGPLIPATPEEASEGLRDTFGHPAETVASLPPETSVFQHAHAHLPTFGLSWRTLLQAGLRFGGLGGWRPDLAIGLEELGDFDVPTLLVWPTNDPFGDVDRGRQIASHLPAAQLHVAGVGHLPWLDDPAGVAELVDAFADAHPEAANH